MGTRDYVSDEYLIDFVDKLDALGESIKDRTGIAYDITDGSARNKQWICYIGDNRYAANTLRELAEIVVERWGGNSLGDNLDLCLEYT